MDHLRASRSRRLGDGSRTTPSVDLSIAPPLLAEASRVLKRGQDFVVGIVLFEPHRELEAGGMEEAEECLEARLTLVALVRRDHRRRH